MSVCPVQIVHNVNDRWRWILLRLPSVFISAVGRVLLYYTYLPIQKDLLKGGEAFISWF